MKPYDQLADKDSVKRTIAALKQNGVTAFFAETREDAIKKVTEIIPEGSEVMTMTSVTLSTLGITDIILKSGKYDAVKNKLKRMDKKTQSSEMRKIGAGPDYAIGSVHAVTESGEVLIASNTGSQLPAYAYGAGKVIWVVGGQKIVKDREEGIRRIYEHCLPLEDVRARKAYGMGSNVSKVLVINKEVAPDRLNMIIINDAIGF